MGESRKRSDSRRRSVVSSAMLCLLLTFSVWRVVRPRDTLMAVESVRNAPPRRRPLPAHLLALRNPADLRFTLVEELYAPLSRPPGSEGGTEGRRLFSGQHC